MFEVEEVPNITNQHVLRVRGIIEASTCRRLSKLAAAGRYLLDRKIFDELSLVPAEHST